MISLICVESSNVLLNMKLEIIGLIFIKSVNMSLNVEIKNYLFDLYGICLCVSEHELSE